MGWCQGLLLLALPFLGISASFSSSLKTIAVFEGADVVIPLSVTSELNFTEIQWTFNLLHNTRLLAMLITGESWRVLTPDKRFKITENGSLVLEDAHFEGAGVYICRFYFSDGSIQKHTVNLQVQTHNISIEKTMEKNSTANQSPDAEEQWTSLKAASIACSVAIAVILVAILPLVIYRCRRVKDEAIYANVIPGQKRFDTTPPVRAAQGQQMKIQVCKAGTTDAG